MKARVARIVAKGRGDNGLPDATAVLSGLSVPLFVVDGRDCFSFVNQDLSGQDSIDDQRLILSVTGSL